MVDFWKETYEKKQVYAGHHFTFEILQGNDHDYADIRLKPTGIYGIDCQPVDRRELKELAEFILNYLENN